MLNPAPIRQLSTYLRYLHSSLFNLTPYTQPHGGTGHWKGMEDTVDNLRLRNYSCLTKTRQHQHLFNINYTLPVFYTPYKRGCPKTSFIHISLNNILHRDKIPTSYSREPAAILNRSFLILPPPKVPLTTWVEPY